MTKHVLIVVLVVASALSTSCGDLFERGGVEVTTRHVFTSAEGDLEHTLQISNVLTEAVQVERVTVGGDAWMIVDTGWLPLRDAMDAGAAIRPLPLTVRPGESLDIRVRVQLDSCDELGDWEVGDDGFFTFDSSVVTRVEVHLVDRPSIIVDHGIGLANFLHKSVCT